MRTKAKKKLLLVTAAFFTGFLVVTIKLSYVMIAQADKYLSLARNLHQRDREIKAPRGSIYDRNGVKIASNKAVYSISVIYSQMTEREKVIKVLSENLKIKESLIRKKVYKNSVREKIKSNVEKTSQTVSVSLNLTGSRWMKTTKEYIHMITWHRKFLDSQEEITRESLDWRFFMIDILKESPEGSGH